MKTIFQTWLLKLKNRKTVLGGLLALGAAAVIWGSGTFGNQNSGEVVPASDAVVKEEIPENSRWEEDFLSEKEKILMVDLYHAVKAGDYTETARLLNENEKDMMTLLNETMEGVRYCFYELESKDDNVVRVLCPLSETEKMDGMVLTRYNTVFYGSFSEGKPEGRCCAVQAMVLDAARYTMADGLWEDGKMNGEGNTGYHYYLNVTGSGLVKTEKIGTYEDNLLTGEITYRTENVAGENLSWKIKVKDGVTVLDDRWIHMPLRSEYQVGAEENPLRFYVLSEERKDAVIWNNLITWN